MVQVSFWEFDSNESFTGTLEAGGQLKLHCLVRRRWINIEIGIIHYLRDIRISLPLQKPLCTFVELAVSFRGSENRVDLR